MKTVASLSDGVTSSSRLLRLTQLRDVTWRSVGDDVTRWRRREPGVTSNVTCLRRCADGGGESVTSTCDVSTATASASLGDDVMVGSGCGGIMSWRQQVERWNDDQLARQTDRSALNTSRRRREAGPGRQRRLASIPRRSSIRARDATSRWRE